MYDLVGCLLQNWLEIQKPTIPNYQNPKTTKTTSRQAKRRICSKTMSMGASLSGDAVNAWSSCSVPAPAKRWKVQRRPNNDVTKEPTKVDQASWFWMVLDWDGMIWMIHEKKMIDIDGWRYLLLWNAGEKAWSGVFHESELAGCYVVCFAFGCWAPFHLYFQKPLWLVLIVSCIVFCNCGSARLGSGFPAAGRDCQSTTTSKDGRLSVCVRWVAARSRNVMASDTRLRLKDKHLSGSVRYGTLKVKGMEFKVWQNLWVRSVNRNIFAVDFQYVSNKENLTWRRVLHMSCLALTPDAIEAPNVHKLHWEHA